MSWSRVIAPWAGVCILAFSSVAVAQTRQGFNPLSQPLRDVGIVRDRVPEPLQHAASDPYAMPVRGDGRLDCSAINTEIASLNGELGSDIDMRIVRREGVGDWVAGAIRGAIDVPYRGVVRRITGAERRDRAIRDATQAGMVRRAFLRGIREANCSGALPPLEGDVLITADAQMPQLMLDPETQVVAAAPPAARPAPSAQTPTATTVALVQTEVAVND